MSNPFNGMMGGQMPGMFGNMQAVMQRFNQFRNTFRGDPKQKVQELLNSGQMSQDQYNQLQQMARQFMSMMPK